MKHKEASQAKKASKAGAGIENLFLALPLGLILEQGGEAVSKDEKGSVVSYESRLMGSAFYVQDSIPSLQTCLCSKIGWLGRVDPSTDPTTDQSSSNPRRKKRVEYFIMKE